MLYSETGRVYSAGGCGCHEVCIGGYRVNGRQGTSFAARIVGVVATGFALAACSFSMPSMDFFSSKPTTAALSIESNPPGADAKLSTGATCRTPCSLTVSLASEFTVAVTLTGYGTETRTVKPVAPEGSSAGAAASLLDPNPLFVELKPPAPPKGPPKKRKRPIQSASPAPPGAPAVPAPAAAAPAPGGFGPASGQVR
jgi:PEGA domain